MKDILLKNDGSINEEGIDKYIENYGIDQPYENRDSIYNFKPPLYVAINSNEIDEHIKVKLVSYLIKKGAKVSPSSDFINIAIHNKNIALADLLLENGASVLRSNENGNLIDIVLKLKNEQVLQWVMANAKPLFWSKLNLPMLDEYQRKLTSSFPNHKDELAKDLKKLAHEKYSQYKFTALGLINNDDAALILAAKMAKKSETEKSHKNSSYVITKDDINTLIKLIKDLVENETTKNVIKFQIILFHAGHAIFGEFLIDKINTPPTVKYSHFDPTPPMLRYDDIITPNFLKQISPLANIEIYDSNVTLLKGIGCTYSAIDGAMMLATPTNRDYAVNVIAYMKKHGKEENVEEFEGKNIIYTKSPSLPTRFIRGMQYIDDEGKLKGLNTLIFNTEEKNTIVNKKGETAESAFIKDKKPGYSTSKDKAVIFNKRAERKMKQYGEIVNNFIKGKDILNPDFYHQCDQYKVNGLIQFCEEQIEKKKEQTLKP